MPFRKIAGFIRRRVLINFRVDPECIRTIVPAPLRPQLVGGTAQAGICLIRLEQLRPAGVPAAFGFASENAAHRIAVEWETASGLQRGVYIPRRDSDSLIARVAGGRLFPGEHHRARFDVRDDGREIALAMTSDDAQTRIELRGRAVTTLPATSRFGSLAAVSAFLERGSIGYSPRAGGTLDGVRLVARRWNLRPLDVDYLRSSYFGDVTRFPPGSVELDCALVMRDTESDWQPAPRLRRESA